MPQQRQRAGADQDQVGEQRERGGLFAADHCRHRKGPGQAQNRDEGPVLQRHQHSRRGREGEQREGQRGRQQPVELVGGVEAGEDRRRAGGGKRLGDVGRARLGRFTPHDPLRAGPQGKPEQHAEGDAHRRCQEAVIDRQFDEKGTAQRQRDTAQPHQPVLDQDLLPALSGRSRRQRRRFGRERGSTRRPFLRAMAPPPAAPRATLGRQILEPGQSLIENLDAGLQGEDSRGQRASTGKRLCRQNRGSDDAQGEQPVHASPPELPAGLADGAFAEPPYCK